MDIIKYDEPAVKEAKTDFGHEDEPPNRTVTIDVGGTLFRTCSQTLDKHPTCRLTMDVEERGYDLFYDRDPTNFRYVLNFMRTGKKIVFPKDRTILREILSEAMFYHLPTLEEHVKESYPVSLNFVSNKGALLNYTETIYLFSAREKGSKLAEMARIHGESGIPVYIFQRDVPGFSPENVRLILEYMRYGPSRIIGEYQKQLQSIPTKFLTHFGLYGLVKLRAKQHTERVRKLSHSSVAAE